MSRRLLLATAVSFSLVSAHAWAGEVNFSGFSVDMGAVSGGQFGTITGFTDGGFPESGSQFGSLAAHSKITFTYSLPDLPLNVFGKPAAALRIMGSYDYETADNRFWGSAEANVSSPPVVGPDQLMNAFDNYGATLPLLIATANLDGITGTAVLENRSGGIAAFSNAIFAFVDGLPAGSSLTYAVSSVPLPAALPMFGAALAGLFGMGRWRKRQAAKIAA